MGGHIIVILFGEGVEEMFSKVTGFGERKLYFQNSSRIGNFQLLTKSCGDASKNKNLPAHFYIFLGFSFELGKIWFSQFFSQKDLVLYAFGPICFWSCMQLVPYAFVPVCIWPHTHLVLYAFDPLPIWSHMHLAPYIFGPIYIWSCMYFIPYAFGPIHI